MGRLSSLLMGEGGGWWGRTQIIRQSNHSILSACRHTVHKWGHVHHFLSKKKINLANLTEQNPHRGVSFLLFRIPPPPPQGMATGKTADNLNLGLRQSQHFRGLIAKLKLNRRGPTVQHSPFTCQVSVSCTMFCVQSPNCKCLRSLGIDSKEAIPPAYVAWRACT
jgi:hypothetical protein